MTTADLLKELKGMNITDVRDIIANLGKLQEVIESIKGLTVNVEGLQPIVDKVSVIVADATKIKDEVKEAIDTVELTLGQLDKINETIDNAERLVEQVQKLEESLKLDLDTENLKIYQDIVTKATEAVEDIKGILDNPQKLDEIVNSVSTKVIAQLDAYIDTKLPEVIAKAQSEADEFVDDTKSSLIPVGIVAAVVGAVIFVGGLVGYHYLALAPLVEQLAK